MESNDENIDSTEDSNSVSTDVKNDSTPLRDKIHKKNTNIVFVSPNELENWDIEESKPKIKKTPKTKSIKTTPKPKIPKTTPKSTRKKRGRPKRKKIQNPWSSDIDDENLGIENELSDDEYFRRLEEASEVYGNTAEVVEPLIAESVDPPEELEEEEEEIYIGTMKTFDLNNSDLYNYILAERDNSLHINDPSKPLINLPPSSNDLKCPKDSVLQLMSIYETVIQYYKILRISPFKIEDFMTAMITNENSNLLSELHISILKLLLREDEISNTSLCPIDQKDGINLAFHLIDSMTWSELLRMYVKSIDYKSQKVHISDAYPFVNVYDRISVLTFLLDLFVLGTSVRNEMARENLITHEDFCRICHTSGEVLCCDSCSAVYHLDCLTPQLTSVPTTTWNCPICVKHKIPGLFDCNFDGEKALVEHKKTPLGQDRFGNTYWFTARRLIVEPRNDNIQNLVELILEKDEEKDFEPVYDNVMYYSTTFALEKVRSQLSRDWEAELCDVFDSLEEEMKKSMEVTKTLSAKGMQKFMKEISKELKVYNVLEEELKQYGQSMSLIEKSEETHLGNVKNIGENLETLDAFGNTLSLKKPIETNESKKCNLKTMSGQPVGVIEDQEGLLVRNIDGSTVRVRLSAKTRSNQLEEVASIYNCEIDESGEEGVIYYRLGEEGDWRFYSNLYSTEFEALSKIQHQEDKDRKRVLGNKYSLNECNEFQWFVSQPSNRAGWPNLLIPNKRPVNDILGGPLNMLQCLRLTLQHMEAQIFSSYMCPAWKTERKNWLINIQRTRNAASLADFVAIFESAIRACSLKKVWTNSLGFLYLDRITAAEREEEKRLKTLERKGVKPDGELVKTRNPGLLKHTIWKTKGEEYRRSSGDGWTWLNVSIIYNAFKLRDYFKSKFGDKEIIVESNFGIHSLLKLPMKKRSRFEFASFENDNDIDDDDDIIDISSNISNNHQLYCPVLDPNGAHKFNSLLGVRLTELENARKDFDVEDSKRKLQDFTNQRNEIRLKKEQLEEKLDILSKNYNKLIQWKTQQQNRKRQFQSFDQSFVNSGEKRMRYQNENSPFMNQYDGADDEDVPTNVEASTQNSLTYIPQNTDNTDMSNANMKPIVINSGNNIRHLCVLNIGQNNANQNRMMLNQPHQFKVVDYNFPQVNGAYQPTQIVRLANNQLLRLVTPPVNHQGVPIRKINPGGQQFVLVNNMGNMGQATIGHPTTVANGHVINQQNIIYGSNNGIQLPVRITTPNCNQQQYKRLLPMEPAMMQQKQMPTIQNIQASNNTSMYSNVIVGTSRMSTPVQGRRTMSKVTHNTDSRIVPTSDTNDELIQRKEMDNLCNEIVSLDQQLDQLDKQIAELENKIEQATMGISEKYKLFNSSSLSCPNEPNNNKIEPEPDRLLPNRNLHKWPLESKQFARSVFLYKVENLRQIILAAGRTEVPGFDVEKKRLNNIFWPYPSSRPGFCVTWRYQVSRVQNSDDLDDRNFDLAATEPCVDPDHEKLKNVGSSGLSCLALCMKILWYSLRWDDMLINWLSSGIPNSINMSQGIYKETLLTGEIVERKIIGWKPLDKYCNVCSYLVTICTTTTASDLPGPSRNRGRVNRRGRQRTSARYTDVDYFTDDGEIDSEDSDPNFIPGVSRAIKSRGRRPRNKNNEDYQATKVPEKRFREEWMEEDLLELWEIRDYLMSISWRKFQIPQNKNQSQIVSSIMNKKEFQRSDNPITARNAMTIVPSNIQYALPTQLNSEINKITPAVNIVVKSEALDMKPVIPVEIKTQDIINRPDIGLNKTVDKLEHIKIETKVLSKSDNLPAKLIIESSNVIKQTIPMEVSDMGIIQNHVVKQIPVPITDIREVSRSEPVHMHFNRGRGRGRARGRGRGRPPMRRSVSSQSEDAKFDDVAIDMEGGITEITNRLNSTKQNIIDTETIKALNKVDDLKFSELAKKESKKIKKNRKEHYRGESSDELTDREVETGSTSPAVDTQPLDDHVPCVPQFNKTANFKPRSVSKRKSRSKKSKNDDSEFSDDNSDDTLQTFEQRSSISIDHNSITEQSKKRKRKNSSDYSTSPVRSSHSKSKKADYHKYSESEIEEEKYCFCKVYDPTQKYIGCDFCERWYHFSCVQMTGKKVSSIETWKCHVCQQKETDEIYCVCKTKYDETKLYIGCDYCDDWYHPHCIGMTEEEANNFQGNYKCPSCKQTKRKTPKKDESTSSATPNSHSIDYERKVNPDIRRKLSELLNRMMKHKSAMYFLKPVDIKACPRYYQVVRSPMDLSTAKSNLDKMKYSTIGSFKLDMHKIFTACRIYFDEKSKEYQSADKLEAYFLTELREIY